MAAGTGAGLNRVGQYGGVTFFPYSLTQDGTYDSGIQILEAIGFTKWNFQLLGTFTGWSVSFYGTIDPAIYKALDVGYQTNIGATNLANLKGNTTLIPSTSWVLLDVPSQQGGTGNPPTNPLVAAQVFLPANLPLVAVRCVAVGSSSTGACVPVGFAVP